MKRLNPFTGQKFKFGEIREDGRVFISYRTTKPISKKGTFYEDWVFKKSFDERYAKNRKWAIQNPERVKQLQKNWHDKNPSRMEELQRNWEALNRPKCNAKAAKRRAAKLQATPLWLTTHQLQEIDEYYAMAKELEKVFPWPPTRRSY